MFSLKKFISEIVLLWLKNWNQCIDIGGGGGLRFGVDYMRGAYTWSNTRVKENVSPSVERRIHGELIGREIWYSFVSMVQKLPKEWPLITDYNSSAENVSMVPT